MKSSKKVFMCESGILHIFLFILMTLFMSLNNISYAAHPLSTDDTGTQGKGRFQFEAQGEFVFDKTTESGVEIKTRSGHLHTVLTYGMLDNVDVLLGIPYNWGKVKEDDLTVYDEKGISDLSIELKWRFYEIQNGISFALKPTITIPTGDNKKDLGTGKTTYGITFITTKEFKPWAFHINLGYTYNNNKLNERKDLLKVSIASEVEFTKSLKIVGEFGASKNPDKSSNKNPAFVTGGLIYSVAENIDLDLGIRAGLNKAESDIAVLTGIALRF